MGWLKEGLQDLAEIQAAEDKRQNFGLGGAICGAIGLGALCFVVYFWANSNYLYSIGCAILFLLMLPPTFICGAKSGCGGCGSLIFCILLVCCDVYSVNWLYNQEEFPVPKNAKHFEGCWKNDSNAFFEVVDDQSGAYFIRDINGKFIATKQNRKICGKNSLNKDFCINVKGDSAYYEIDGATTNFIRISKEEYDKIFEMRQNAIMEQKQAESAKNQSKPKTIQKKKKKVKKTQKPAANTEE